MDGFRRKAVKKRIISWMHCHELPLQMGGQLGDLQAMLGNLPLQLIAVCLALRCFLQVDQAALPGGDLNAFVAEIRHIAADAVQCIEGGFLSHKLSQEDSRALDSFHIIVDLSCNV